MKKKNIFVIFQIDYLGEFEAICEMALAPESGPYRILFVEKKTNGRNSHANGYYVSEL
jgi:hypothetical protein